MQALTTKELNYLDDLLGGEALLAKTCAIALPTATQQDVHQFLHHAVAEHQRRHDELMHVLTSHQNAAR